ncbi:MAG: 5'/3'-nucleotidase SurE [Planctomycetes bacterium]|nr:5'/3'-nucleotidase SurE [Planctomycetota bacterium]
MTILLTNDDGIEAPGLYLLAQMLQQFDEVMISAPEEEQSGVGHAITFRKPIAVTELAEKPAGVARLAVRGTPADAVKFALRHHLNNPPALVVSGPNQGPNIGVNVLYSGTIGAAYEAVIGGVSALAVSSDIQAGEYDWTACLHFAEQVVKLALAQESDRREHPESYLRHGVARPFLWNLNVPSLPLAEIKGLAVTRHGTSGFDEFFSPHHNGEPGEYMMDGVFATQDPGENYDASAIQAGYASLTPLALDLTDVERFEPLTNTFMHPKQNS